MSQHERRTPRARGDEGFTLIELMVVISILGILAGLAIPRLSVYRAEAKKIEAVAFGRQVLNTLTVHAANDLRGKYPLIETCEGLDTFLLENGFPLTQKQKQNYCPEDSSLVFIEYCQCRKKSSSVEYEYYYCDGSVNPVPESCHPDSGSISFTWVLPDQVFQAEQFLMISTSGEVGVITEDEIPTIGFVE